MGRIEQVPWNKGRKMSEVPGWIHPMLGKQHSEESIKKIRKTKLGKKLSEEHKRKIGNSNKGKHYYWLGKKQPAEMIAKRVIKLIGKKFPGRKHKKERKEKMSVKHMGHKSYFPEGYVAWNKGLPGLKGEKNPCWIKDRSKLKKANEHRFDYAHKDWSKRVKNRDKWKCKLANEFCSGKLEAHHILGYSSHPELRYLINNGITLCHAHHPRKRAEEKRLAPKLMELVSVSKE